MIRIYFGQVRRHSPNARLCLWREDYEDDLFLGKYTANALGSLIAVSDVKQRLRSR